MSIAWTQFFLTEKVTHEIIYNYIPTNQLLLDYPPSNDLHDIKGLHCIFYPKKGESIIISCKYIDSYLWLRQKYWEFEKKNDRNGAANLLNVKWFYCNDRIPSAKVQEYTNALQFNQYTTWTD